MLPPKLVLCAAAGERAEHVIVTVDAASEMPRPVIESASEPAEYTSVDAREKVIKWLKYGNSAIDL